MSHYKIGQLTKTMGFHLIYLNIMKSLVLFIHTKMKKQIIATMNLGNLGD